MNVCYLCRAGDCSHVFSYTLDPAETVSVCSLLYLSNQVRSLVLYSTVHNTDVTCSLISLCKLSFFRFLEIFYKSFTILQHCFCFILLGWQNKASVCQWNLIIFLILSIDYQLCTLNYQFCQLLSEP